MHRIMFVCHGNICRSPMAELVLRHMVNELGVGDKFQISSSATSSEEIWGGVGNPVYPPAARVLRRHGISPDGKRAVRLRADDADDYDLFIGMDSANIRNMHRMLPPTAHHKIHRMMEYAGRDSDVADPWYTGDFDTTYDDISTACKGLLRELLGEEIADD